MNRKEVYEAVEEFTSECSPFSAYIQEKVPGTGLKGGHWITTHTGRHVYIGDRGANKGRVLAGPSELIGQRVGKKTVGAADILKAEAERTKLSAKVKFDRVDELEKKFNAITGENARNQKSKDIKIAEHADCASLVMHTAIRPGYDVDTHAKVKAYGATTLEGRHVNVDSKGDVSLKFVGKKGVNQDIPITDSKVASMLKAKAKQAGETGRLFSRVSGESLLAYIKKFDGGGFKTKDLRTYVGTNTAKDTIAGMAIPKNATQYKAAVRQVAEVVSKKLGNTPTIALQSYINPKVFIKWRKSANVE
jgi:DNA topoisomerase-1